MPQKIIVDRCRMHRSRVASACPSPRVPEEKGGSAILSFVVTLCAVGAVLLLPIGSGASVLAALAASVVAAVFCYKTNGYKGIIGAVAASLLALVALFVVNVSKEQRRMEMKMRQDMLYRERQGARSVY